MRSYFTAAFTAVALFVALLGLAVSNASGSGIVIAPGIDNVVAFCDTPTSWTVTANADASADAIASVEALAAQHCPTLAY
jgi:hypothetical protein